MVVLYACRLVNQKQPLLLAEAISQVLLRHTGLPSIRVLIAGVGPLERRMRMWLRARLNVAQLSQIEFLGAVPIAHMYDLTLAADISILPSVFEGIPTTFYESMAVGGVVVTADVGAVSELVENGKTGVLVRYDGIEELAKRGQALKPASPLFFSVAQQYAEHVISLAVDTSKRAAMSAAARHRVQQFNMRSTVQLINSKLRDLLKNTHNMSRRPVDQAAMNIGAEAYRWALVGDHGEKGMTHGAPLESN